MTDFTSATLHALAVGNGWAPALAFAAGVTVSIGPCVAPRFLALAALTVDKPFKESLRVLAAFTGGLVTAYSLLAIGGSFLWHLFKYSEYIYASGAMVMGAMGFAMLLKRGRSCEHARPTRCGSIGSTFLLGAASTATLSPCCMPILAASIAYGSTTGLGFTGLTISCFALGHAAPFALFATGWRGFATSLSSRTLEASRIVGGALMLALAGFYGVLA